MKPKDFTITIKADTWMFGKRLNKAQWSIDKANGLLWSRCGWKRLLRPFILFHFWWVKPV